MTVEVMPHVCLTLFMMTIHSVAMQNTIHILDPLFLLFQVQRPYHIACGLGRLVDARDDYIQSEDGCSYLTSILTRF